MNDLQLCEVFKALGDPTRLGIVRLLIGKEMCVCEIMDAFAKSQPAISHHLKILKQAGLLSEVREGKWIMYSLRSQIVCDAAKILQTFTCKTIVRIEPRKSCVE
ncbi:MAG: metalloregulator ArsR/SmtB family transcription factor [Negativicutes bacterium]|jgi:ArsR family transcriptional regulator